MGADDFPSFAVRLNSLTLGLPSSTAEEFCESLVEDVGLCGVPGVRISGSQRSEMRTSHVRGPREMSCPAFRAIKTPPAWKRAHRPHTSSVETKIYWGFKRALLI